MSDWRKYLPIDNASRITSPPPPTPCEYLKSRIYDTVFANMSDSVYVAAPEVVIMDENSHEVSERYYKAGSAVELTCLATQVEETGDYVSWRHGDVTLSKGIR